MTQEDKQLLLQDLSARLFYGVKVDHFGTPKEVIGIFSDIVQVGYDINDYEDTAIEDIKPYLRPMSSMTEEEKKEICEIEGRLNFPCKYTKLTFSVDELDWLNRKMFSYRTIDGKDMFELGLALETPEGMYDRI